MLPRDLAALTERVRRLEVRLERERLARREAERILENKSRELFDANQQLGRQADDLERRVAERTRELADERQRAVVAAEVDALTGIGNRASFNRALATRLARAPRGPLTLLLIDLDDFKVVNDTWGHAAGDTLLVETARRLSASVRPGDWVGRLGGDEFAVLIEGNPEPQLGYRLQTTLSQPVSVEGRPTPCLCSIGVAHADCDADTPETLLRNADLALYQAKRQGRGAVASYEQRLREALAARAEADRRVRLAVAQDRIEPWYQPLWHVSSGRLRSAEVLARWHDGEGRVINPGEFIETVSSLNLLDAMMENVLRRAFAEACAPARSGHLEHLSINVSPTQFTGEWVSERLPQLLQATDFPTQNLVVEVTETALVQDMPRTREVMAGLTSHGIRIAVDDFGVGYSNFATLRQLPFQTLKLDRSLTCDVDHDPDALVVAECIVELANRLDIAVIAEGIESVGQAERLQRAGCEWLQGYLYARPARELRL